MQHARAANTIVVLISFFIFSDFIGFYNNVAFKCCHCIFRLGAYPEFPTPDANS